ncbi:MAG: ATP-dependent DNA helicase RecG [Chthonomonadales bacterium]|nr:ATP-dependent DNA helicase RecG [Chthonomonadales bacterium]
MPATPAGSGSGASRNADPGSPRLLSLADDVQYVRGVGPQVARLLGKVGVATVGDLLWHVPRRYEDRTRFRAIAELRPGEWATVHGKVAAVARQSAARRGLTITRVLVDDGTAVAQIVLFQRPYLYRQFQELHRSGAEIVVYALARDAGFGPVELDRAEWEVAGGDDALSVDRIVPVYATTEGIAQRRWRRMVDVALHTHLTVVPDPVPLDARSALGLADGRDALRETHFPASAEALALARRTLAFGELLVLQTGIARRRAARAHGAGAHPLAVDAACAEREIAALVPFALTGAQRRVIGEIAGDVRRAYPMNRMVQGDVGSGKTVVALAAMLMAVRGGYQAALMAPTEILAQQHAIVLRHMLEPAGIRVELATGRASAGERAGARERLVSGAARLVVGTHALIQDDVAFERLALVVIDEQHRFGVLQRQALRRKGAAPHVLVMTATPIPRTLTLTLYGDLDTSILDELPPGRQPIRTHWKPRSSAPSVYAGVARLLASGRQAYVVCPLVEESENLQAAAATRLAADIQERYLAGYRVGLLHGQMKPAERDAAMVRFKARETDVLVATTVIEVGIDVPNAVCIVVEDADRFGLAQLHQLRGRVGRGAHASYCVLLADPKTEDGRARMEAMVATQDGFRIAEEDLRLRGPGDFAGTRQSGLPELHVADLLRDMDLMEEARQVARRIAAQDPGLERAEHRSLREAVDASAARYDLVHVS